MEKISSVENITKGILATTYIVIGYLANSLGGLIIMLVLLMIFDYITGIISAYINKNLESREGLRGISKKYRLFCL